MAAPVAKCFVALCNSLKIKLESKKATQIDFLRSARANLPAISSCPQIKELFASLAWVRSDSYDFFPSFPTFRVFHVTIFGAS